jgi:hypothetical protein
MVSVFPSSVKASRGQNFSIGVNVTGVSDLFAWEFKLNWTTTILNVVSVSEGSFLRSGGTTFFAYKMNSTEGYLSVDCTLLGNIPGVSGNGVLANVTFNVKNSGQSLLNLYYAVLLNSMQQAIPTQLSGGQFNSSAHDVEITSVDTAKDSGRTVIGQGFSTNISVAMKNFGIYSESVNTTAYVNTTAIATQSVILESGVFTNITFAWNTTGFAYGSYTISANVTLAPGETNSWTGPFIYGTVKVTIPGDINGDGVVNLKDITLIALHWLQKVPPAPANADINGDGVINLKDVTIIALNWLKHA